ncbi:MAG TPA: twin-arginine translocase TatA/TatE family subunit [Chloroflexota bacterium]|jgi:sec-independent protein translocase protein TatA|nr:twin-arginine translocase TatA/TatE family subunit [Chloroflexota bacterium]
MPALGPWELVIILLIVVVIFGAGRLAEIGGAVGKSVREFRSATQDDKDKEKDKDKNAAAATTTAATSAQAASPPPRATVAAAPAGSAAAPAPTSAAPENKCPSCATVNPAGQVFCGQCGTRLTAAVA